MLEEFYPDGDPEEGLPPLVSLGEKLKSRAERGRKLSGMPEPSAGIDDDSEPHSDAAVRQEVAGSAYMTHSLSQLLPLFLRGVGFFPVIASLSLSKSPARRMPCAVTFRPFHQSPLPDAPVDRHAPNVPIARPEPD